MHQRQSSFHSCDDTNWIRSLSGREIKQSLFSMHSAFHNHCISADCLYPQKKRLIEEVIIPPDTEASIPLTSTRLLKLHSAQLKHCDTIRLKQSRLYHLFMGIKDIPFEMQVNANRLRICFGLLFVCWSAFTSTFPFLFGGR